MTPSELRAQRDVEIKELREKYARRIAAAEASLPEKDAPRLHPMFAKKIALAQKAKDLRAAGLSFAEIGRRIGRTPVIVQGYLAVGSNGLSVRSQNSLWFLTSIKDITPDEAASLVSYSELKNMRNVGKKTLTEIKMWLADHGLEMKP